MSKAQEIIEYLKAHPAFFEDHQDLLAEMKLSGAQGVAPFHERQVQVLKERENQHRAKLSLIVDSAKANQHLELALHQLARELITNSHASSPSSESLAKLIETEFKVDQIVVLFETAGKGGQENKIGYGAVSQRVAHIGSVCDDRLSSSTIESLFGCANQAINSCAFIPLTFSDKLKGVLILGSADVDQFKPGFGVMFLDRLGELSSAYLQKDLSD